jgi:dTDP-4-amino-4,6-dideoxygalactose transaminase
VETKIHYADPLYDLPLGYDFVDNTKPYQGAETLCRETLSLPIYPELTDGEVEHIAASIKKFFS